MADTELKYLDKDGLSHFLQAIRGDSTPLVDGTAAVGTAKKFSRQDHVHPTDTTRAPLASPALTGTPTAPTAATGTSTTQIATTEFVANTVGAMTSGVSDVKVDNTSVVTSGVANINTFTGATASANGTKGLVPAPSSGSNKLWWVLSANGAWKGIGIKASNNASGGGSESIGNPEISGDYIFYTLANASTSVSGLMSYSDKTKLNGIATGAEVNQNTFSNVAVSGQTTVEADSKTDTLTLEAGANVTITTDATNDKVTIAATDTTYSTATTSANGLMSSSDKTKLNGIATGAEVNQNAFSNVIVGSNTIQADSKTDTLTFNSGQEGYIVISANPTTDAILFEFDDQFFISDNQLLSKAFVNVSDGANTLTASGHDTLTITDDGYVSVFANTTTNKLNISFDSYGWIGDFSGIADGLCPLDSNAKIDSSYYTDTKNTAGSTDSSSKLFLVGATSQATNPQTYSQDTAYVGTDGHLYSNSKKVVNLSDSQALTNKTYNGYTLGAACAKGVVTSISADSADVPTVTAVKNYVSTAVTGAAAFQGSVSTTFAPTNYKAGYYWVVAVAGTYAGQTCEVGDMIFATADGTTYSASDFDVIQTNLNLAAITNAEIDTIVAS